MMKRGTENNKLAIVGTIDRQSGKRHGCDMQPVNLTKCHTHVTDDAGWVQSIESSRSA